MAPGRRPEGYLFCEDHHTMTSEDVVQLYELLGEAGIDVWIDGGWAVDALLGDQTRAHEDLDVVIQVKDVARVRALLADRGYRDVERDDTRDWNFVLGDDEGRLVDIHAIVFDAEGNAIYGPEELGILYPALTGHGLIAGYPVKCTSPDSIVKFRRGYSLRERDVHDVSLLCRRFGIPLPEEYQSLIASPPGADA